MKGEKSFCQGGFLSYSMEIDCGGSSGGGGDGGRGVLEGE